MKMILLVVMMLAALAFVGCDSDAEPVATVPENNLPEKVEMFFVYSIRCMACEDVVSQFNELVDALPEGVFDPVRHEITMVNVVPEGGRERFEEITQEYLNTDTSHFTLPLLIINGAVHQGMESIANNLSESIQVASHDLFVRGYVFNPRYMLRGDRLFENYSAPDDAVTLVYFYRIVCPACMTIADDIAAIPDSVLVGGRETPVNLVTFNTRSGNNVERVLAFFEYYNVPEDMQRVPIIFTADGFYTGEEEILGLLESLGDGAVTGFQFP